MAIISLGIILLLLTSTIPHCESYPELTTKRYTFSLGTVLNRMLDRLPQCDLILLQDDYFSSNLNSWIGSFAYPYYSITLDGKPFPDYTTWQKITKATGFLCSTVVATCETFASCRIPDSKTLYTMLVANGILLQQRRSLLFIQKLNFTSTSPTFPTYARQLPEPFDIPEMNRAKEILKELNSHITLIREVSNPRKYLNDPPQDVRDIIYETLTFTPNWFPGGSPILRNLWSVSGHYFRNQKVELSLSMARPMGNVTVCAYSKQLLPTFAATEDGNLLGLDGYLLSLFLSRFKLDLTLIEPRSKDFGTKNQYGHWSGVIGEVVRKHADLGLGQLAFTLDRFASGLEFSPSVEILSGVVVCPVPRYLPRYQILSFPFDTVTWVVVGCSSLVCIVVIEILQRVANALFGLKFNVGRKTIFIKLRRQRKLPWIQSLGPLFLRSIPVQGLPRRWAILGLFSVWLLFTFIINVSYTTILIGALTVSPREPYLRSPNDLLVSGKEWTLSPLVQQTIENSLLEKEKNLVKGAKPIPESSSVVNVTNDLPPDAAVYSYINSTGNCGVAEVTRSKYYLSQNFTVRIKNHEYSRVYLSRESIVLGPTGWAIREDMDFLMLSYFDQLVLSYKCYGFNLGLISKWIRREKRFVENTIAPLSMAALEPVFTFGFCGMALGFLMFTLEILNNVRMSRTRNKVRKVKKV